MRCQGIIYISRIFYPGKLYLQVQHSVEAVGEPEGWAAEALSARTRTAIYNTRFAYHLSPRFRSGSCFCDLPRERSPLRFASDYHHLRFRYCEYCVAVPCILVSIYLRPCMYSCAILPQVHVRQNREGRWPRRRWVLSHSINHPIIIILFPQQHALCGLISLV